MDNFIKLLVSWIEDNLDEHSLLISEVAKKSGYSQWYLQRLFRNATGISLGRYIKLRRLSIAAINLKLTKEPILNIALRYHFGSQQTFTRRFREYFGITPAAWRNEKIWDFSNILPALNLVRTEQSFSEVKEITFNTLFIKHYHCVMELNDVLTNAEVTTKKLSFLNEFISELSLSEGEVIIFTNYFYTGLYNQVGITYEFMVAEVSGQRKNTKKQTLMSNQKYLCFTLTDRELSHQEEVSLIYWSVLPSINCKRRPDVDITILDVRDIIRHNFKCRYLVPVV